jgi:endoglucanase
MSAWGKAIWGSDSDKSSLFSDFKLFNGNFTGIPAFVGEFGASPVTTETAGRWKYLPLDFIARRAKSFNYSLILWDNGADYFNHTGNSWNDPIILDVWFNTVVGRNNTLADSTTATQAISQNTSAYIFHKVGDPIVPQTAMYLLNGNTLKSVKNTAGAILTSFHYTITGGTVTLSKEYLSTVYTSTATPGIKETLLLTFSSGTPVALTIVQYAIPTLPTSTYKIDISTDLHVPVTYAGVLVVAAVKATLADGTFLADSWTKWLGPLRQGRWTLGDWYCDKSTFSIDVAGLQEMTAANQTVTLTLEVSSFASRHEGEMVEQC